MRAPRDRTAARRARPGPLLGAATAITAVVGLVLGAAGGTHALWNDQITADLGIIQVGPGTPTPSLPPGMLCRQNDAMNVWVEFSIPDWVSGYTRFAASVGNWTYPGDLNSSGANGFNITSTEWPQIGIGDPVAGRYQSATVLVTLLSEPHTVVAESTVWFTRDAHNPLVSCTAPLSATQPSGEGS